MAFLLRGNLDRSIEYHPLAPLVAAVGVAGAVWWWGRRRRGWPLPPLVLVNSALIAAVVLLIGVWVARIATGTLPPV
jgi:hypothetical protein